MAKHLNTAWEYIPLALIYPGQSAHRHPSTRLVGKGNVPVGRRGRGSVLCLLEHTVDGLDHGRLVSDGAEFVVEDGLADDVQ